MDAYVHEELIDSYGGWILTYMKTQMYSRWLEAHMSNTHAKVEQHGLVGGGMTGWHGRIGGPCHGSEGDGKAVLSFFLLFLSQRKFLSGVLRPN